MIFIETFKREFRLIFKNKSLMVLLFIGPIFLTFMFGGVYYNDYVKDIPIAILDEDCSGLSMRVSNYFLNSERFDVTNYPSSRQELQNLIDEGKVQMGIWIPDDFESKVATYESSEILAVVDGTNLVVANNAIAQAAMITQSVSAGIEMKLIQGKGMTPQVAEDMALVFNLGERILYDPKMTYINYLIICFLAVFIQQLMLSALGTIFIEDSEYISGKNAVQKVLGALSACFAGILPAAALSMAVLLKFFHVHMIGNIWTVMLLTVAFVLAISGMSLIIASVTKSRVKYLQFSFMLSLPTFIASGCVWPVSQMPKLLEIIVRVFWPVINYAKIAQEVLIKGMDFAAVVPNLLQLLLFSFIWLPVGIICYKRAFNTNKLQSQTSIAN